MAALLSAGKDVFVPKVDGPKPGDMRMLRLESLEQLDLFQLSKWKIPEPPLDLAAEMDDALNGDAAKGV